MGGKSSEREVSLSSGQMVLDALDASKYTAFPVDTARFGADMLSPGMKSLSGMLNASECGIGNALECETGEVEGTRGKPDVVFIALHGRFGEDGTIQGLLELLEVPYVGSGVLASALAIDKLMTRKVLQADGILVPRGIEVCRSTGLDEIEQRVELETGLPAVVKPNTEGSSIGLSIAHTKEDLRSALTEAFKYDERLLIEEYVSGIEITAPVIGNRELRPLPLIEIIPAGHFYDYHSKYANGGSEHVIPARISADLTERAQELGLRCHRALGCMGMSRTDMIVRGEDIYVLEVNTIPGMTPTSLLPQAAAAVGISFPQLLDTLIGYALEKRKND
jgi:D-alanine-D-alanine ligase